jgi:GTP-binding protein HflX
LRKFKSQKDIERTEFWSLGEKPVKGLREDTEYAVLVGLIWGQQTEEQVEEYLDELQFLAETAGALTRKRVMQRLPHPENKTFIGSGKVKEIADYIEANPEITMVIFDDDLTGKQSNALEEALKVKIVDRSSLILDIFARRAQTAQAKTQVELAQLQYLLPRLRGLWTHLERQRGGIGMRGPGEKEIETDRRLVRDKIIFLKRELEVIDRQAQTQRKQRGAMIRVALVGYTNVGKSTLMNLIAKSEVFAENKLFATLDTTVRKVVFEAVPFLLSDTVGFIRKLPHHLVESFKSTLDETRESDILLHVVDIAHPQYEDQISAVNQTLTDLKVLEKPTLMVFNKIDLYRTRNYDDMLTEAERAEIEADFQKQVKEKYDVESVIVSAHNKEGVDELRETLLRLLKEQYVIRYPHQAKFW